MTLGFFVTGTDTEIGKTLVSCVLLKKLALQGYKVAGMKPIASGAHQQNSNVLRNADAEVLRLHSNVTLDYQQVNPYCFAPAIAPHIAAKQAGISIEIDTIQKAYAAISEKVDYVIVEGVGGWSVPINDQQTVADLAIALGLPVILVVGMRLGCINHALLTYQAMASYDINIKGWIANQIEPDMPVYDECLQTLQNKMDITFLGSIPYLNKGDIDLSQLTNNLESLL